MNCRIFERQAADWLAGHLTPERARRMAAHYDRCPACARAAAAEEKLRAAWQAGSAGRPAPDLWPRLAQRLAAQEQKKAPQPLAAPRFRWAVSGAALVAAVAFSCWRMIPMDPGLTHGRVVSPTIGQTSTPPAAAWSGLGDVAQSNPTVDDPAGTSIENVWTHLNTDNGTAGRG